MTTAIDKYIEFPISCENITVSFGGFKALKNISLSFPKGKTTAIIGPNGAGKTTLLNVLSGRQTVSSGKVFINQEDVTNMHPRELSGKGVSRSFQLVSIFPDFTVYENFRLAAQRVELSRPIFWKPVSRINSLKKRADEMLETMGLADRKDVLAGTLSHGEQRAIEIGLSLMGNPETLLLDEPLAGAGQAEMSRFVELLSKFSQDRTVILIEHNMAAVMSLADQMIVMVGGEVIAAGTPREIQNNQQVVEAYLGQGYEDDA